MLTCIYEGTYKVSWIQVSLQVIRLSRIPGWMSTSSGVCWWRSSKSKREGESGRERTREGGIGNREGETAAMRACILHFIAVWSPLCDVDRREWGIVWGWGETPPPFCHLQQIQVALWSYWPQIIIFNDFNSCFAASLEGGSWLLGLNSLLSDHLLYF